MLNVLSYSIWVGGTDRVNELVKMIKLKQPDIVGLVEATDPQVFEELAEKLDMKYRQLSGLSKHEEDWHVGILSRLPFVGEPKIYKLVDSSPVTNIPKEETPPPTKPVLEVCIEEQPGKQVVIFITHLTANFSDLSAGDKTRKKQVREVLRIMASKREKGIPHLLMGDFSAIVRGDTLKGSALLRYVVNLQKDYQERPMDFLEYPSLDYVVPSPFLIFSGFLRFVPQSKFLSFLFDFATTLIRAPRGDLHRLRKAKYTDCFRRKNSRANGFTAPTVAPAARFDFIFASPELTERLEICSVIENAEDIKGVDASDHFPVYAKFG